MSSDDTKIPLPAYLKLFTSNTIPMPKAMAIAGKIYKEYNTRSTLTQLTDVKLNAAGIENQEDRKLILTALRKAGYAYKGKPLSKAKVLPSPSTEASTSQQSTSATEIKDLSPAAARSSSVSSPKTPTRRKRKRLDATENEFLPSGPSEEVEDFGTLEFNEVLDEEALKGKATLINRAPVMMAWAMYVAERMHFTRPEALSIASVYTEMNAVTKGVSLGIYTKEHDRGREASRDGSQPYVELIGRRVPLYRPQGGQWRALSNGSPVIPSVAFSYITRSFRQTTPYIMGALKLLAESYTPEELNQKAWSLYAEFRPEVNEWGKRSEVKCSVILGLRKQKPIEDDLQPAKVVKPVVNQESVPDNASSSDEQKAKRPRFLTVEEYEAALDLDTTFNDVNLDLS